VGRGNKQTKAPWAAVAAAVVAFVVAGPAGGATTGSSLGVVLRPLIGTSSNEVQQVTFGGKIGFHLDVSNTGTSTVNHLVMVVASDLATFSDASRSECARDPQDAKRMVCTLKQMKPGSPVFGVDLRFNAPASGSTVITTPSVTVDAQTQGGSGSNGTTTTTGTPVTTALISSAANSLVKTFAKGKEGVATSTVLPQHSQFTMPNSLLGGFYGVETSVQETTESPLCTKCPQYVTLLDIPASLLTTSPFSATNSFSFTVTLLPSGWPNGYSPTGLYHDGVLVPMCATSPLGPSTHMCLTSFKAKKQDGIVAIGEADQNGRIGFG
jgi:hypothetical protein